MCLLSKALGKTILWAYIIGTFLPNKRDTSPEFLGWVSQLYIAVCLHMEPKISCESRHNKLLAWILFGLHTYFLKTEIYT